MSTVVQRTLDSIRERLALCLPDRVMSIDLIDFQNRRPEELAKGIVVVVMPKLERAETDWDAYLSLTLVGQLAVPERGGTPVDIEKAETAMFAQLSAFLRNSGQGIPHLKFEDVRFSGQVEFPYGWVSISLRCGPVDLGDGDDSEIYPPTVTLVPLAGVDVLVDLQDRGSEVYQQWNEGNFSGGEPDLTANVELENYGNNPS